MKMMVVMRVISIQMKDNIPDIEDFTDMGKGKGTSKGTAKGKRQRKRQRTCQRRRQSKREKEKALPRTAWA